MHKHIVAAILLFLSTSAWLIAQAPAPKAQGMHRVGGPARDGASAFPRVTYAEVTPKTPGQLDFQHYHTYDETVALLNGWTAKYPQLVELYTVGESLEGRQIWQITIANKKNLKHTDRPAFFIEEAVAIEILARVLVEQAVLTRTIPVR